jgi:hypothetical protein
MADEERIIVVEGCVEFSEKRRITELMDVRVLYFAVDGERTRDPEGMESKRLVMVAEMITEIPEIPDCAFRG